MNTTNHFTASMSRRALAAWLAGGLALGAAVGGAHVAGPDGGRLALMVATLSATSANNLQGIGDALPLGYAFAAGMAAAVNPCGFALLPAYLGLYLGTSGSSGAIGRALAISAAMTASFVALFGTVGLALSAAGSLIVGVLPWAAALVGLLLVVAGGRLLAGGSLYLSATERLADRLGGVAGRTGLRSYAAYGLAFALTSLGCTLPIFLTVVGSALTANGVAAGLIEFVLYALGMGLVLTVLTVVAGLFGRALLAPVARLGRYLEPASAILLLLTGAYVIYYWLTVGGLLG